MLVTRLVQLQILDHERFTELSQGNRFRIEPLPPTRGIIYDRNGLVIAENRPNWELVAIGEQIDNLERTLRSLEELGLVDPAEHDTLRNLIRSHRGFERVKLSNLSEEQAATFAVRRHLFSGVDIQEALSRYYPFGEASAHAIGYVGSISASRSRAHRPQQLRGHLAHRQDRHRARLRGSAARPGRLSASSS